MIQENKKGRRQMYAALDVFHIVVGVLIVLFAVLAFLNPEKYQILFPVIFFLASVLNFANGYDRFHRNRGRKKQKTVGTALIVLGTGLFLLCVLSALTIWWG